MVHTNDARGFPKMDDMWNQWLYYVIPKTFTDVALINDVALMNNKTLETI